jgi:hypothetical protein
MLINGQKTEKEGRRGKAVRVSAEDMSFNLQAENEFWTKTSVRICGAVSVRRLNPKSPTYEASVLTSLTQCSEHTKVGKHRPKPIARSQSARTSSSRLHVRVHCDLRD